MLSCLSKKKGVSLNLVNKQISLATQRGFFTLSFSNKFFSIEGGVQASAKPHILVSGGGLGSLKVTPNFGIRYTFALPHLENPKRARLSFSDKLRWFFIKFRYTGKGLKIKKGSNTGTVIFNLGSSHISKIHYNSKRIQILRTKKNTYTLLALSKQNTLTAKDIRNVRPYNIYTRRGIRLSRQNIFRRFGKVSQVASKKK